jgi:hypothetical protein
VTYSHKYSFKPEYQGYFLAGESDLCVGLTVPQCADSLEDWELQPKGLSRPVMGEFYLSLFQLLVCYSTACFKCYCGQNMRSRELNRPGCGDFIVGWVCMRTRSMTLLDGSQSSTP